MLTRDDKYKKYGIDDADFEKYSHIHTPQEVYDNVKQIGYLQALSDALIYALKVARETHESSVIDVCEYLFGLAQIKQKEK